MKLELVATKPKAMVLEVVGNNQLDAIKFKVEHNWLGLLQVDKFQLNYGRHVINHFW